MSDREEEELAQLDREIAELFDMSEDQWRYRQHRDHKIAYMQTYRAAHLERCREIAREYMRRKRGYYNRNKHEDKEATA